MDDQIEHFEKWNVISLSLVLNFVPKPKDRGMFGYFLLWKLDLQQATVRAYVIFSL